ncbi:alpha carbonic anhydrase 8 [Drosophila madeirensis]|uniref:Alpha carbonic anhydrase 8 n=1 Tax=Drosophila madeirensis TaxID=30013 RepID=A0AAU9FCU2_DROMD
MKLLKFFAFVCVGTFAVLHSVYGAPAPSPAPEPNPAADPKPKADPNRGYGLKTLPEPSKSPVADPSPNPSPVAAPLAAPMMPQPMLLSEKSDANFVALSASPEPAPAPAPAPGPLPVFLDPMGYAGSLDDMAPDGIAEALPA